jgi:hypothetical protein
MDLRELQNYFLGSSGQEKLLFSLALAKESLRKTSLSSSKDKGVPGKRRLLLQKVSGV